jgi:hypothetical protein
MSFDDVHPPLRGQILQGNFHSPANTLLVGTMHIHDVERATDQVSDSALLHILFSFSFTAS